MRVLANHSNLRPCPLLHSVNVTTVWVCAHLRRRLKVPSKMQTPKPTCSLNKSSRQNVTNTKLDRLHMRIATVLPVCHLLSW